MIQERARTDIVMQRSVLAPGAGPWHRNTGPSFVYVVQGQLKLQEFSDKSGCSYTQVRTPGEVYFIEADQIYRALVVSSENVVLMVTRFDVPVGGAIQIPVSDPGC
jgi:quercetin dioxygenase-like cupin family protein